MHYVAIIISILILASCTIEPTVTVDRSSELVGKVYHFTTEFDEDNCELSPRAVCYNSTYIGFRENNEFIHISRCAGYERYYSGKYYFKDTLKLVFTNYSMYEVYYDNSDSLIQRIIDKKTTIKNISPKKYIPDTCELKPYFVDATVHEFGWSKHSVTHEGIYGMLDTNMVINDMIKRMQICGEWKEL